MRLKEVYQYAVGSLKNAGLENPELETRLLLSHILKLSQSALFTEYENKISLSEHRKIIQWVQNKKEHKPTAYLLKEKEFYNLKFFVDQRVLIPRPETEEFTEWILKSHHKKKSILDVGTGSGCIGISLAAFGDFSSVTISDASKQALQVAKKNAERLLKNKRIKIVASDLFKVFNRKNDLFDIIVSNPPYIRTWEKETVAKEVLYFEPHIALFNPKNNFIKRLIRGAYLHLKPRGWLYLENHPNMIQKIKENLLKQGFKNIEIKKDLSQRYRFIRAQKIAKNNFLCSVF